MTANVGVLGPSQVSMTTLMRDPGLLPLLGGKIRVLGKPAQRATGPGQAMPQTRGALDQLRLTGWDFVASGYRASLACRCWTDHARRDVGWALERVQATELVRWPLAETSAASGMAKAGVQALLGRPRLYRWMNR